MGVILTLSSLFSGKKTTVNVGFIIIIITRAIMQITVKRIMAIIILILI